MPSVFDSFLFNSRLFNARRDASEPPPGARDARLEVAAGVTLHARVHALPVSRATVVLFHGNGEVVADYDLVAARFAALGLALAVIDYRGYGASQGRPTLRACMADAVPAVAALKRLLPQDQPHVLFGRSLGAMFAAEIVAEAPELADGLVLESAGASLRALLTRRGLPAETEFDADDARAFDPLPKLARCRVPAIVVHGSRDAVIPPDEARVTAAALDPAPRLVFIPGRGHNDLAAEPLYWKVLDEFVADLVAARG